jgi:hypothetical protein
MKTPRVHDFDPTAKPPELSSPLDNFPVIQKPQPQSPQQQKHEILPERPNVPTPERSNVRRIITRNSFEIYEDQMDALRRRAYQQKMQGELGSMSQMVREAIDKYLKDTDK